MHHLANVNISKLRAPLDDPLVADFVAGLPVVNALADHSPGFVWRLQTEDGDATAVRAFPDPDVIVNLAVWESVEALREFTYRGAHRDVFRRRNEWFHDEGRALALWWLRAGTVPTIDDARRRVEFIIAHGPTPYAFTFASVTPPLDFESVPLDDSRAQRLIAALDHELQDRYPEPGANHFRLDAADVTSPNGAFLVASLDGEAIACGAVRRIEEHVGEIKRMYVSPAARGKKLGQALLAELEGSARRLGLTTLRLETGERQPDALTIYARAGFRRIPCWGEYADTPLSVCMEKSCA